MNRYLPVFIILPTSLLLRLGIAPIPQDSEAQLVKQIATVDKHLLDALGSLARKYDKDGDPEAAHFFAECAIGFGSKEEKADEIRRMTEYSVYYGKVRGGKVMTQVGEIGGTLRPIANRYKQIVEKLVRDGKKGELPDVKKAILQDCVVKYEIARGASEYIRATQRFNELRRNMGLRAILWDFENSRKLILASWYMAETLDLYEETSQKDSVFYTKQVEFAKQHSGRWTETILNWPERMRAAARPRQPLLNTNARRLWMGHWEAWGKLAHVTAYNIPALPYREDIPTPRERFAGKTVAKDWVDTENTIQVHDRTIPFAFYPYDGERDAPFAFLGGRGEELGWTDPPGGELAKHGLPIMFRFFSELDLSDLAVTLKAAGGKNIACRIFRDGSKDVQLDSWPTVLILPNEHLEKGADFTMEIRCKLNGVPFEKSWSFRTRWK